MAGPCLRESSSAAGPDCPASAAPGGPRRVLRQRPFHRPRAPRPASGARCACRHAHAAPHRTLTRPAKAGVPQATAVARARVQYRTDAWRVAPLQVADITYATSNGRPIVPLAPTPARQIVALANDFICAIIFSPA